MQARSTQGFISKEVVLSKSRKITSAALFGFSHFAKSSIWLQLLAWWLRWSIPRNLKEVRARWNVGGGSGGRCCQERWNQSLLLPKWRLCKDVWATLESGEHVFSSKCRMKPEKDTSFRQSPPLETIIRSKWVSKDIWLWIRQNHRNCLVWYTPKPQSDLI